MSIELLGLLIIFQFKHFLADFPLQTEYMLGKFKDKGWLLPLLVHCLVQAGFTFTISLIVSNSMLLALKLAMFDLTIHGIMDRIKASPKLLGRFQTLTKRDFVEHSNRIRDLNEYIENIPDHDIKFRKEYQDRINETESAFKDKKRSNKLFWWSLGIDQMVHGITDLLIVYFLMR